LRQSTRRGEHVWWNTIKHSQNVPSYSVSIQSINWFHISPRIHIHRLFVCN
jgi:hypothetical protein